MEMRNTLAPAAAKKSDLITYSSNGEDVQLSIGRIKKYLVNGGGQITDDEAVMFLSLCRYQHLNPFLREAYLIKYGSNSPATIVTGKDVFLKRAQRNPDFAGVQCGIIVMDTETGQITEREGTFFLDDAENLVGGWAKVYIKNRAIPFYESVRLSEYIGRKKSGEVNEQWSKRPATMIRKVALVHALKEAFPDELGALYAQEEIEGAQDIILDETPIRVEAEPAPVYETAAGTYAEPAYEQAAFYPETPAAGPESVLFS